MTRRYLHRMLSAAIEPDRAEQPAATAGSAPAPAAKLPPKSSRPGRKKTRVARPRPAASHNL